jgi:hypothetical protein
MLMPSFYNLCSKSSIREEHFKNKNGKIAEPAVNPRLWEKKNARVNNLKNQGRAAAQAGL